MPPPIAEFLFDNSIEKHDYERMTEEWIQLHREKADEPCQCPCGKKGIVELCYISNVLTKYTCFVGNCCVKHVKSENGFCSSPLCPYRCISQDAHFCTYHAHNRKDAPTGRISRGKWAGRRYDDPALVGYAQWALRERSPGVDRHYLAYLDLKARRATYAAQLKKRIVFSQDIV